MPAILAAQQPADRYIYAGVQAGEAPCGKSRIFGTMAFGMLVMFGICWLMLGIFDSQ